MTVLLIKSSSNLGISKGMIYYEVSQNSDEYEIVVINSKNSGVTLQETLGIQRFVSILPLQSIFSKSIRYKIAIKEIDAIYIFSDRVKLSSFFIEKMCENLIPIYQCGPEPYSIFPFALHGSPLARITQLQDFRMEIHQKSMQNNLTDISYLKSFVTGELMVIIKNIFRKFKSYMVNEYQTVKIYQKYDPSINKLNLQHIYSSFIDESSSKYTNGEQFDNKRFDLSKLILLARWLHIYIFITILNDIEIITKLSWVERNLDAICDAILLDKDNLREPTSKSLIMALEQTRRWDLLPNVILCNNILSSQISLIISVSGLIPNATGICFNLQMDLLMQLERQIVFYVIVVNRKFDKDILITFFERLFDDKLQLRGRILGTCHSFAKSLTTGESYKLITYGRDG